MVACPHSPSGPKNTTLRLATPAPTRLATPVQTAPSALPRGETERAEQQLRASLTASIQALYRPAPNRKGRAVVSYSGPVTPLPRGWRLEFLQGEGHKHGLVSTCIKQVGDHAVEVEEVTWTQAGVGSKLRRASLRDQDCARLTSMVRVLPTISMRSVLEGDQPPGTWASNLDVLLLLRLSDSVKGVGIYEKRFTGSPAYDKQGRYLPLLVVFRAVERLLLGAKWSAISTSRFRESHFSGSFLRAQGSPGRMPDWVTRRVVRALAVFGNESVLPGLGALRDSQAQKLQSRPRLPTDLLDSLDQLLLEPKKWLGGPPKRLP